MPRPLKLTPFKNNGVWIIHVPARFSDSGKNQRLYFKSKKEAELRQRELLAAIACYGESSHVLSQAEASEIDSIRKLVAPYGVTLRQVVLEWVERRKATECKCVRDVVDGYLKQFAGRSRNYERAVRVNCSKMVERFGEVPVDDLMPVEFEEWLWGITGTPYSFAYALKGLKAVFAWARSKRLSKINPVESVQQRKLPNFVPKILTVEQVEGLLGACRDYRGDVACPKIIRCDASDAYVAVAFLLFAGVRPKELTRLTWDDVFVSKGLIRVSADSSKTGALRLVQLESNLMELVMTVPERERVGAIVPRNWVRKWKAVRKGAGVEREQDVCRHSYASYWLAFYGDMNLLLQNMGHTTQQVTLKHYLTAAERSEAERFWGLDLVRRLG